MAGPDRVKNVIVLGGSYAGCRAADLLARTLPSTHRVVLIDRQSHFNHLYLFPRLGVVPSHAHKAFIPYTGKFGNSQEAAAPALAPVPDTTVAAKKMSSCQSQMAYPHSSSTRQKAIFMHANVLEIGEGYVKVDRGSAQDTGAEITAGGLAELLEKTGLEESDQDENGNRTVPWDFLIYALGCTLPPPLISPARTKQAGVDFLEAQQKLIENSRSILIAGGGALGIQYATDIADLYNNPANKHLLPVGSNGPRPKRVTIVHSRQNFLPLYSEEVDTEVKKRMRQLGIDVVLGERLQLPSPAELCAQEQDGRMRELTLRDGRTIRYDLLMRCTGQAPNSALMKSFLPAALNDDGYINVESTLQVALPPSDAARDNVFAIGDVAAAGVIKAGHTGWNQAGIAVQNIMHILRAPYADRTQTGQPDALGVLITEPVQYSKSPPQIKVTLGLNHSVSELLPAMDAEQTVVKMASDGPVDGHYAMVWKGMGVDHSDPWI